MKFHVPADILEAGKINFRRQGNDVVILIRNTDIDRDDIVEHQP